MSKRKDMIILHNITGYKFSYLKKVYRKHKYDFWGAYYEIQFSSAYHMDKLCKEINDRLIPALNRMAVSAKTFNENIRALTEKENEKC